MCALFWVVATVTAQRKASVSKALYGVTYSPFALDLDDMCLPTGDVLADMKQIWGLAESVRIYSVSVCPDTTDTILKFAKENDMKVLLGLFISNDTALNTAEVKAMVPLMKDFGDTIEAVVVGNEVVIGGLVDPMDLVAYIIEVRTVLRANNLKHPVTTAEVWPTLESEVGEAIVNASDFICMNMQPFWEGWDIECPPSTPYPCVGAGEYVNEKAAGLEEYFGKDLWLCESGWPTMGERCCIDGREFGRAGLLAGPSQSNATIFMEDLVEKARETDRPLFYHTMFDSDWKRIWAPCGDCTGLETLLEDPDCNTCELDYHWGIHFSNRTRKPDFDVISPP